MTSARLLAAILALAAASAHAQETATVIAGMGETDCADITGVDNLDMLAGATDWGLGYLAGRQDAGHAATDGTPLSLTEPADVAIAMRLYCDEFPYAQVIDALRDYGTRAFAAGPEATPSLQPRLPNMRPRVRPDPWPPEAQLDRPELVVAATSGWLPNTRPLPRPGAFDAVVSTRSAE